MTRRTTVQISVIVRYHPIGRCGRSAAPDTEALMTLEQVFDIAKRKRFLVVSTVNESGAPEAALMGFALTQANEIVFDTLASSRKAVNLARNPKAALVDRLGRPDFSSDRGHSAPTGRRRPGERQGGLFPRMAGWPRPRGLARHRLCRREAQVDTIFQLCRWSAGRRGVQALATGSAPTPSLRPLP